jgi:hypothetical protein
VEHLNYVNMKRSVQFSMQFYSHGNYPVTNQHLLCGSVVIWKKLNSSFVISRVVDPNSDPDLDPAFFLNPDPDPQRKI